MRSCGSACVLPFERNKHTLVCSPIWISSVLPNHWAITLPSPATSRAATSLAWSWGSSHRPAMCGHGPGWLMCASTSDLLMATVRVAVIWWAKVHCGSSLPLEQAWIKEEDEAQDGYGSDTRKNEVWERNSICVSASRPLVGFGKLNDNTIKGLISLLSIEQEIESIAYTCGLCINKHI